jgi:hypothetical protein
MDDILYILLGIAWILYAFYKGNKKQKARRSGPATTGAQKADNPSSVKDFESVLSQFMGVEEEAEEPEQKPLHANEYFSRSSEEYEKPGLKPKTYETLEGESLEIIEPGISKINKQQKYKRSVEEQKEEIRNILKYHTASHEQTLLSGYQFDLRKAVIFSEILRRPYN